MEIKEGTTVTINHSRYGIFRAVARHDFDTKRNWYPVALADGETVQGMTKTWCAGDNIPCRRRESHIEVVEEVAA